MSGTRQPSFLFLAVKPIYDCLAFRGRSTRTEVVAFCLLGMVANSFRLEGVELPAALVIGWAALWSLPLPALTVRRLHDQGRSAVWMLVLYAAAALLFAIAAALPQVQGGTTLTLALWTAYPTGPWVPLLAICYVGLIFTTIVLHLMPGEPGANRYGADPRRLSSPMPTATQ